MPSRPLAVSASGHSLKDLFFHSTIAMLLIACLRSQCGHDPARASRCSSCGAQLGAPPLLLLQARRW